MTNTRFHSRIAAFTFFTVIVFLFSSTASAEFYSVGVNPNVRINVEDGALQDVMILNTKSGEILFSGFDIGFMDSSDILSSATMMFSHVEEAAGIVKLYMTSEIADVSVTYKSDDKLNLIRKTLNICSKNKTAVTVDGVVVEEVDSDPIAYHGGRGQPVFKKSFFLGLESPIGYNLIDPAFIVLMHYPGKTLYTGECFDSFTAVIGADSGEGVEEAFRKYIDSIRYSFKSNLHYNSWFDIRSNNMSTENFADIFKAFKENLSKYDVALDYFVVDDGWQNKDSIWESSVKTFPNGFGPLRDILEAGGTHFGLWMPLSGYLLNPSWGEKNGYEVHEDERYYCMAGPKFNKQLRARIKELVEKEGVRYFKHDFNYFECYWPGQTYPRTQRHSFEANVNAEAALLDYIHEVNPDVFLNVTSNMWLSPWWLMHADTIWMHAGDYGYNYAGATLEPREWAMTYVDAFLYQRLVVEGARFPMNAIMTHGIIDGVLNRLGGENESFRTWADNVILYFGRGVYMRELYISPQLLNDRQWQFLSAAAKWAKSMDNVFRRTEWVGGDPNKGEAYGYHHYGGGENWYVLRNPDIRVQKIEIPLKEDEMLQVVYPVYYYDDQGVVWLGGHDVKVIRIIPKIDNPPMFFMGLVFSDRDKDTNGLKSFNANMFMPLDMYQTLRQDDSCRRVGKDYICSVSYSTSQFLEDAQNSNLFIMVSSDNSYPINEIEIDGINQTTNTGWGWRIFKTSIQELEGERQIRIPFEALHLTPFVNAKVNLQFFLEREISTEVYSDPDLDSACIDCITRILPPLRDSDKLRLIDYTWAKIIDFTGPELPPTPPPTDSDLKTIKAAKLRMRVFGSRSYDVMRHVMLNGRIISTVPINDFPHDFWQEHVIDLPLDALGAIRLENKLVIKDMTSDTYKFTDVQLAVQLADGTWRNTNMDSRMQYKSGGEDGWEYAEGKEFDNNSRPVTLKFE